MKRSFTVQGTAIKQDNLNPNKFGGMCSRTIVIDKAKADPDSDAGIDTIATTADPALVIDWGRWQIIREILPMRYCEMPDNDKTPLLDAHARYTIDNVKGSAMKWNASSALTCKTFVSQSEPTIKTKIKEGHIDSVSIGYMTDEAYTVEIPKNALVVVDGVGYENKFEDDYPMVVRTWWKPHELSLVPIGADARAKFKSFADMNVKQVFDMMADMKKEFDSKLESFKQQNPQPQTQSTEQKQETETQPETKLTLTDEQLKEYKILKAKKAFNDFIRYKKGIV